MKAKRDALNEIVQNLTVKLYEQAAAQAQAAQGDAQAQADTNASGDDVVDAEFEEID